MKINSTIRILIFSSFCFLTYFNSAVAAPLTPIVGVPNKAIGDIIGDLTGWIIGFGVTICVLALIWGGITYISSFGNQELAQKAKKAINYAILGLLTIGLSYAIIEVIDDVIVN